MSSSSFRGLFVLLLIALFNTLSAQKKYALIIAAGQYKNWPKIHSMNDVPYIRSALETQGFPEGNIALLTESAVTMDGIRDAFKTLISKVSEGDVVVVHFSSHGEQVADDNNDEADGKDEAIVTYNAAYPVTSENYEKDQAEYFRDDDFGKFVDQIRAKLGASGDLLVILDACHSGSGTRGENLVRGGQPPLVPKGFKPPATDNSGSPDVFMEKSTVKGPLSSYIVISGAQATESNSEMLDTAGVAMGSLTYAISQALAELKPGTTYRSFFADVLSAMNRVVPQQHPVIEGNGIDRELFGGRFREQQPYAEILKIDGNNYTLNQGQLAGISTGSGVSLFPKGTLDPASATALAKGTVKKSTAYSATVVWDKDPGLLVTSDAWVFVTKPVFNIPPVIISLAPKDKAPGFSAAEQANINMELKDIPTVKMTGIPELRLIKGKEADSLMITSSGYVFDTFHAAEKGELAALLKRYVQYKFMQQLNLADPLCPLEVSIIPVVNDKVSTESIPRFTKNGLLEFRDNDQFVIRAVNKGKTDLYINILDFQPDGKINAIFPNSDAVPEIQKSSLKVEAGKDFIFKDFPITIHPPLGLETFKIFVSPMEIDMESMAKSAGAIHRGNLSGLEDLVNGSYNVATRGGESSSKASGSAFNLVFRIVQ